MAEGYTEEDFAFWRRVAHREKGTPRGDKALELLRAHGQPTLEVPGPSEAAAHFGTLGRRMIDAAGLGFPERIGDRIRAIGDRTIDDVRRERYKAEDEFRADHPWQAVGADVAGGLGGMLAALFGAPFTGGASLGTIPARIGAIANAVTGTNRWRRAATLGAAGGGVSGWNVSREDDDYAARAKEALADAGVGAVAGPVMEAAATPVVRGAQWVANSFSPAARTEARSLRRVGAAVEDSAEDHGVDPVERVAQIKASLDDKQIGSIGSQPHRVVDAGGEQLEYLGANVLMSHSGSGKFRRFLIGRQSGDPETGMLSHQQRMARAVDDAFDVPLDTETGRPFTARELHDQSEEQLTKEYRKAYAAADEAFKARGLDRMEINVNRAVQALERITGRGLLHGGGQLGAKNLDRMITGILKKLRSAKPMALDPDEAVLLMDLGEGLFAAPPREAVHEFKAAMDVVRAKLKEANKLEAALLKAQERQGKAKSAKDGRVSKAEAKVEAAQQAFDEISGQTGLSEDRIAQLRAAIEADEAWVANARAEMEARAAAPESEAAPQPETAADPVDQAAAVKAGAADDGPGPKPSETPLWTHEPDEKRIKDLVRLRDTAKDGLINSAVVGKPWTEPVLYENFQRAKMDVMDAEEGPGAAREMIDGIIAKAEGWQSGGASQPSWAGVFGGGSGAPPNEHMVRGAADALAGKPPDASHIKGKGMKANREEYAKGHAQVSLALKLRDDYPERPPEWHAEQQRLSDMNDWKRRKSAAEWQAGYDRANEAMGDLPPDFDPQTIAKEWKGEATGTRQSQSFRMRTGENAKHIRDIREEIEFDESLIKEHTAAGNTESAERTANRLEARREDLDEALRERQRLFMAERAVRVGGADPSESNGDVFQIIKGQFGDVKDLSLITDPSLARTGRQGQNLGLSEKQMAEWEELRKSAPADAPPAESAPEPKVAAAEQAAADVQAMSPEDYAKANPDSHTARLIRAREDLRTAETGQSEARRALAAAQSGDADEAMLDGLEKALEESGASVKGLRKQVSGLEMADRDPPVLMHELEQQRTLLARYEDELEAAGGEEADFALERVQETERRIAALEGSLERAGVSPQVAAAEAVADEVGTGVAFKEGDGAHGLDVESTGVPHPVRTDLPDPDGIAVRLMEAREAVRAAKRGGGKDPQAIKDAERELRAIAKEVGALDEDTLVQAMIGAQMWRRANVNPHGRSLGGGHYAPSQAWKNAGGDINVIQKALAGRIGADAADGLRYESLAYARNESLDDVRATYGSGEIPEWSLVNRLGGGAPEAPPASPQVEAAQQVAEEAGAAPPAAERPVYRTTDKYPEGPPMETIDDLNALAGDETAEQFAEAVRRRADGEGGNYWTGKYDSSPESYPTDELMHIVEDIEAQLLSGQEIHAAKNAKRVKKGQKELPYDWNEGEDNVGRYVLEEINKASEAMDIVNRRADFHGQPRPYPEGRETPYFLPEPEVWARYGVDPFEPPANPAHPWSTGADHEIAHVEQRIGAARAAMESAEAGGDPKAVAAAQTRLDKATADLEKAKAAGPTAGKAAEAAARDAELIGSGNAAITGLRSEANEIERAAYEKAMATHDDLEVPNKEVYRRVPQEELRPGQVLPEDTMVVQRQAARAGDVRDIGEELKVVSEREAASRSTPTREAPQRPEFVQAAQAIRDDLQEVWPEISHADKVYGIGAQRRDAVMGSQKKRSRLTGGHRVASSPKMEAADAVAHYHAAGRAGDEADEYLGTAVEGDGFRSNFRAGYAAGMREKILARPADANVAKELTADSKLAAAQEIAADGAGLRRAIDDENEMFETTRRLTGAVPSHESRLSGRFDLANISRGVEHIYRGRAGIGFGNLSLVDRFADLRRGAATNEAIADILMSPDGDELSAAIARLSRDRAQRKLVSDALRTAVAPDRTGQGGFGM